jgi:DNA-binding MarR family transcriptional regulator
MNEDRDSGNSDERNEIDRFITNRIDSVPHLEALLLLWRSRSEETVWSGEALARRLWVQPSVAKNILKDLERDQLIAAAAKGDDQYHYHSEADLDRLLEAVEKAYAREMVRISTMIHLKGSAAIRDFARAFRFKKEQE